MENKIAAISFQQKGRDILLFSLTANELIEISYFNPREIDRLDGVQRKHDVRRSRDIANFISTDEDAILANNIIINLELEKHKLSIDMIYNDGKLNVEKLKEVSSNSRDNKIAFVIDGQHRLRAFELLEDKNYKLPVSALIDLSLAEAAELFVQINYNQKPVNKSLVLDLLGISSDIFPKYYMLHKAVVQLQENSNSPFYNKIKMLGVGKGFISQASVITALEKYKIQSIIEKYFDKCTEDDIYDVLWHFFVAVEDAFPEYWGEKRLLSKTVGIRALIKILRDILVYHFSNDLEYSNDAIYALFKKIDPDMLNDKIYSSLIGEQGVTLLYEALRAELSI